MILLAYRELLSEKLVQNMTLEFLSLLAATTASDRILNSILRKFIPERNSTDTLLNRVNLLQPEDAVNVKRENYFWLYAENPIIY